MRWSVLRAWASGTLVVSAMLLLFMVYLLPLPFVVAQDYSDRVAMASLAAFVLIASVAGFVVIAVLKRDRWEEDQGVSLALQAAAAFMAWAASSSAGFGA